MRHPFIELRLVARNIAQNIKNFIMKITIFDALSVWGECISTGGEVSAENTEKYGCRLKN